MAVAVGFEPTVESPTHAFEACSFGRSDATADETTTAAAGAEVEGP